MTLKFALSMFAGPGLIVGVSLAAGDYHTNTSDCIGCHSNVIDRPVEHFIETNADCVYCHEISPSAGMTTVSEDQVCQVCHVANSDVVEAGAHSGVPCMNCHEPHSGDYLHRFRQAEVSLCLGSCHGEHDLGVSHPIGETVTDPRIGGAMSCVSTCHSMHQAKKPPMLQMAALDLCRECHADKF